MKKLVHRWFDVWRKGNFQDIPVTDDFKHTSPYGTIEGKKEYLEVVEANREKFLGHTFEIHDEIYAEKEGCIRYTARKDDFFLEVTEWHFASEDGISEIVAYYNIEEKRIEL